ncbi:MAG TPA: hypothetical protein DGN59_23030 [Candidatus Latescibacteria bacterium]|jgi:hypothetical protein|nr:hypothetical protein [Candidatus Latescibacterota bacterium]HJN79367.1 GC-type dockerin domain-anchored protein [Phycisphaerales bacterium]|tara:strand:+ start:199 stop:600 length:402 start_codon:yes stop_codon:yes gene_type:complete
MTRPRHILILAALGLIASLASAVGFGGWLEHGTQYAGVEMTGDGFTLIGRAGQPAVGQAVGDGWTLYGGASATAPEAPCLGDMDGSGSVDITDLLAFLAVFGTPEADLDGDGVGDVNDLLILLSQFGSVCDGI